MARELTGRRFDRRIIDGPMLGAIWLLAGPTMLQNAAAGLQGMVDPTLVGHFVGYTANAAIGVSWQIILVVITFIASLYTGTSVFVARYAGAEDAEGVSHVVYQAFVASLVPFFLVSNLLLLNQFPDVEADRFAGRKHFPILVGRTVSGYIYISFLIAAYFSDTNKSYDERNAVLAEVGRIVAGALAEPASR